MVTQQSELGLIRPIIVGDSRKPYQLTEIDRRLKAKAKLSKIWPLQRTDAKAQWTSLGRRNIKRCVGGWVCLTVRRPCGRRALIMGSALKPTRQKQENLEIGSEQKHT